MATSQNKSKENKCIPQKYNNKQKKLGVMINITWNFLHKEDASLDDFALRFSKWPLSLYFRKPFDLTHGEFKTDTLFDKPSISSAILCYLTSFSSKFAFEPNFDDSLSIFSLSPNSIF